MESAEGSPFIFCRLINKVPLPVLAIGFLITCSILLLQKYYIIAIILSCFFTISVIAWKLRINPDDFRKVAELYSEQQQSNSNDNNINQNDNNINQNNNRMSNMDRLRILLSGEDFDPNDFSLLGQLDQDNNESMLKGLTMDQIQTIPTKKLENTLDGDCTICLLKLQKNEEIRILPCEHQYHVECIDLWLNRRSHCPMCKTPILLDMLPESPDLSFGNVIPKMVIKIKNESDQTFMYV